MKTAHKTRTMELLEDEIVDLESKLKAINHSLSCKRRALLILTQESQVSIGHDAKTIRGHVKGASKEARFGV